MYTASKSENVQGLLPQMKKLYEAYKYKRMFYSIQYIMQAWFDLQAFRKKKEKEKEKKTKGKQTKKQQQQQQTNKRPTGYQGHK